jgi:hypothetical protein
MEPAKKRYSEQAFITPADMEAMRTKMQANLEKMKSCPAPQGRPPVDNSKCDMSPPTIDVHKTGDTTSIAGHDAHRTVATLTQSCTDKQTGDVCDTVIAVDVWLTDDSIAGTADRREFDAAYARKLGLNDPNGIMQGQAAKFLAAYQTQIKQLTDKSGDFKGQSLKTSLRVLMGGPHCSAAARTNSTSGDGTATNIGQAGQAIGAQVGQLMGGLFHKKKTDDSQGAASTAGPNDPYAQYIQMASFSSETVTVTSDPIPAARFDIPPEWTKEEPKPAKSGDGEYTCPKS